MARGRDGGNQRAGVVNCPERTYMDLDSFMETQHHASDIPP